MSEMRVIFPLRKIFKSLQPSFTPSSLWHLTPSYGDIVISLIEQLPLFSIVHFPNEECSSSSSSTRLGTCYTSSECSSKSGTASGSCALGFGVCCVISTSTCGSSVSTNTTYISNPGYPNSITPASTGSCSFTINKAFDDVCQLREGWK